MHLDISFQDLLYSTFIRNATTLSERDHPSQFGMSNVASNDITHSTIDLRSQEYDFLNIEGKLKDLGLTMDNVDSVYPCSPMQENIYVARQMGSPNLYWTQSIYEIQPFYTYSQIREAWVKITQRHEALRTLYFETRDERSERILDAVVLSRQATAASLITIFDQRGEFDCKPVPLEGCSGVKPYVYHRITISADTTVDGNPRTLITIELDHMIVDLSSLVIVINEFSQALQGQLVSEQWPMGYRRFIEYLGFGTKEDEALDYWITYLESTKPCMFPLFSADESDAEQHDHVQQGGSAESIDISLVTPLTRVREFCKKTSITVATAIEATWAQVLHIYSGQDDVCFGHISSGRDLPVPGIAEIVGPVMSLLVTCVRDIAKRSIQELVTSIRDDYINALSHQCFSLRKAQRILGNNDATLFNTVVTTMYDPQSSRDYDRGWSIKFVASHNASEYDIVVKAVYTDVDLTARLAYSSKALSRSMATHVAQTFASILDRMVDSVLMRSDLISESDAPLSQPCPRVSEMVKASPYDIQQIYAWNKQSLCDECPKDLLQKDGSDSLPFTITRMIVNAAQRQPHAPAVYAWDGCMTYSDLDTASTRMAHLITSAGNSDTSFEDFEYIPLCFEKSKWYSVALLGVLKSGKAFVPLDLDSNPEDRLRRMLGRLDDPKLILCSSQNAAKCSRLAKEVLVCDENIFGDKIGENHISNVNVAESRPNDPAYVIFTVS